MGDGAPREEKEVGRVDQVLPGKVEPTPDQLFEKVRKNLVPELRNLQERMQATVDGLVESGADESNPELVRMRAIIFEMDRYVDQCGNAEVVDNTDGEGE